MTTWPQLEAYTTELVAAVTTLISQCQNVDDGSGVDVPPEAALEARWARRTTMANIAKLQTLLVEPVDLLQELARRNQLLACIHWLGEFQVLACIPLRGSVPFKDIAELVEVPETQLCQIVRMTATAGFLHEPRPSHVAHSALSRLFVTKPSYLDAAMFLSETAAPAALHMAAATQRFRQSKQPHESAYNIAHNTSATFASVYEQQPKLQRQWLAYLRYAVGEEDSSVTDVLTCFDWLSLGNAVVVEVGARSNATALALADLYPELHFVVQMNEPPSTANRLTRESTSSSRWALPTPPETRTLVSGVELGELSPQLASRIRVEKRIQTTTQNVEGAAVYVLHLPSPSPTAPSRSLPPQIIAELKAHLGVLRASSDSRLILTARLLPETNTVDPEVAAMARLRDLSLLQLANERELEMVDCMNILNSVSDGIGRLALVNKLRAWNNATVAFEVRYQAFDDPHKFWPGATSNT